MEMTTTPMSKEEIVENLKTMVFGKQAFERFNAKERETLDRAWNIIDQYENRLKADMVAMLTEIQLEIEEMSGLVTEIHGKEWNEVNVIHSQDILSFIQQKINALKKSNARCELCKFYRFDDWWAIGWCPKPSIYEVRKEPGDKCEYFELKENKDAI